MFGDGDAISKVVGVGKFIVIVFVLENFNVKLFFFPELFLVN